MHGISPECVVAIAEVLAKCQDFSKEMKVNIM